jgi:hypothetical protein
MTWSFRLLPNPCTICAYFDQHVSIALEALASDFAMNALALEGEGTSGELAGSDGRGA